MDNAYRDSFLKLVKFISIFHKLNANLKKKYFAFCNVKI